MTRLVVLLLAVLFALNSEDVKGNPATVVKHSNNVEHHRNTRIFRPVSKDWSHFHQSWSLPTLPSFSSVSNLFKDEDDDITVMRKRIQALEKSQKDILALLKRMTSATKTPICNDKSDAVQSSSSDLPQKVPGSNENQKVEPRPESSDITTDKKGNAAQNTKKDEAQSGGPMKGDESVAMDGDKEDVAPTETHENEDASSTEDGKDGNTATKEHEEKETTAAKGDEKEAAAAMKQTEKLEKPNEPEETKEPEAQLPNDKFESHDAEKENNDQSTIHGNGEENLANDSENSSSIADNEAQQSGMIAAIVGVAAKDAKLKKSEK